MLVGPSLRSTLPVCIHVLHIPVPESTDTLHCCIPVCKGRSTSTSYGEYQHLQRAPTFGMSLLIGLKLVLNESARRMACNFCSCSSSAPPPPPPPPLRSPLPFAMLLRSGLSYSSCPRLCASAAPAAQPVPFSLLPPSPANNPQSPHVC